MTEQQSIPKLMEEPPISVYPSLAVHFKNVNTALILQQLHFLLGITEKAKNKYNLIDGRWWVYNTYPEWRKEHFPWLSEVTIRRLFKELEEAGIVLVKQSVKHKSDRRKWYSINHEVLMVILTPTDQNDQMVEPIKMITSTNRSKRSDGYTENTTENTEQRPTSSKNEEVTASGEIPDSDVAFENNTKRIMEQCVRTSWKEGERCTITADDRLETFCAGCELHAKSCDAQQSHIGALCEIPEKQCVVCQGTFSSVFVAYHHPGYVLVCDWCNMWLDALPPQPQPEKKPTPHTLMKNAIVAAMGWDAKKIPKTTWGQINAVSEQLRAADCTPEDIPGLHAATKRESESGQWAFKNPMAMVTRWPEYSAAEARHEAIPLYGPNGLVDESLPNAPPEAPPDAPDDSEDGDHVMIELTPEELEIERKAKAKMYGGGAE